MDRFTKAIFIDLNVVIPYHKNKNAQPDENLELVLQSITETKTPLYSLTNANRRISDHVYTNHPFAMDFDDHYFSWELGVEKPCKEAYIRALDRAGFNAESVILIDYDMKNSMMAGILGMQTLTQDIDFIDSKGLRSKIAELGVSKVYQ